MKTNKKVKIVFLLVGVGTLTIFSFKFAPAFVKKGDSQTNSVNIINNIANNGIEKSEYKNNVLDNDKYPNEIILLVGKAYSGFNEKFNIALVEIIENKEATIKFNLNPTFSQVTIGDFTAFEIDNRNYLLRIIEVNGRDGYIKFKILSQ